MSLATTAGLAPRDLSAVNPKRAKHIRLMCAEAEQIIRIGFDFRGQAFEGDVAHLARVRRGLLAHLRPMPIEGASL